MKTIILNKYGLPIEQKTNVYSDYCSILDYKNKLNNPDLKNQKNQKDTELSQYNKLKMNIIKDIKNLDFEKDEYINYLNENLLNKNKNNDNYNGKNIDYDIENIHYLVKEDLDSNNITNFDFLFNKLL